MRKILSRVLFLIMINICSLSAMVQLQAPVYFHEGESLRFSIVAKGFEVEFPKINQIEGVWVDTLETKEELVRAVRLEAVDVAVKLAREILAREVNRSIHESVVKEFVKKLK